MAHSDEKEDAVGHHNSNESYIEENHDELACFLVVGGLLGFGLQEEQVPLKDFEQAVEENGANDCDEGVKGKGEPDQGLVVEQPNDILK